MQPRTHNSYGQERRAQEKVERPCKARTGAWARTPMICTLWESSSLSKSCYNFLLFLQHYPLSEIILMVCSFVHIYVPHTVFHNICISLSFSPLHPELNIILSTEWEWNLIKLISMI
jgi:hypothetical protein